MVDSILVLTNPSDGRVATKMYSSGLRTLNKPHFAAKVRARTHPISDIHDLSRLLVSLEGDPYFFAVRASLRHGDEAESVNWKSKGPDAALISGPRSWIMLDIDRLDLPDHLADFNACPEAVVEYAIEQLPPEFSGVVCHWRLSAGMGTKRGIRLHLWFWLSRPIMGSEAREWLAASPVDLNMFNRGQPHITADPIFAVPSENPVERRSGL